MKVKTSVTLSEDIIAALRKISRKGESRSTAIERLLRHTLATEARRAADARDVELINRHANDLNREAEDALRYQIDL